MVVSESWPAPLAVPALISLKKHRSRHRRITTGSPTGPVRNAPLATIDPALRTK